MVSTPSSASSTPAEARALFTQRVVVTDSYMSDPCPALDPVYSEFRNAEVKKVPVIRIFGVTPKGQKVCAHVHGVFPYFYILDDGSNELELALEIDRALNENFVDSIPSTSAKTNNNRRFAPQHVFKIIKVSGRSLYGYYSKDSIFFKIYFYNPWTASKAANLASKGKIFGKMYDTFETHISFVLQFFMDYGIFGMNLVHFRSIYFRREFSDSYMGNEEEELEIIDSYERFWDLNHIPDSYLSSSVAGKTTHCDLEIDVIASNIIIILTNKSNSIINPGIEAIWEDERNRRFKNRLSSNIEMPESQVRDLNYEMLPTEEKFASKLWDKVLAYKEKNDSQSQHSLKSNFSESSFENLPPASQIHYNLPSSEHDTTLLSQAFTQNDDDDDDDNFLDLLERMAARKLLDYENIEEQLNKSIDEDEEFEKEDGDDEEDENDSKKNDIWNDTFMTPSLEAFLNEAEGEFQLHKQDKIKSPSPKEAAAAEESAATSDDNLNTNDLETIIDDEIEKWETNRNNSDSDPKAKEMEVVEEESEQIVQQNSENFETQGIIFKEYSQEIWADLHETICGDSDNDDVKIEEDADIFSDLESEIEKDENKPDSHIEELPSTETEEDEIKDGQENMESEIILSDMEDNDDDENEILGIQSFYEYSSPVDSNFDINISLNSPECCSPDMFEGLDDNDNTTEEMDCEEIDDDISNQLVQSTVKSNRSRVLTSDSDSDDGAIEKTPNKSKVKKRPRPDPNIKYDRVERKKKHRRKVLAREQLERSCLAYPNNPEYEEWFPLKHFPSQKLFKKWYSQKISEDYNENPASVSSDYSSDGISKNKEDEPCSSSKNTKANINLDDSLFESQEDAFHQAIKKSEMVQTYKVQFRGGNMEDLSDEDEDTPANSPALSQIQNQSISSPPEQACKSDDGEISPVSPKSMMSTPKSRRKRGLDMRKLSWQNPIELSEGEDDKSPSPSPRTPTNSNSLRKDLRIETLIKCSNTNPCSPITSNSESFIGSTPEKGDCSEIDGPRLDNTFGFKHNVSNYQNVRVAQSHQYLTTMCVEVFCSIRGELLPNPEFDQILGIFILFLNDVPDDDIRPKNYYVSLIVTLESIPYCRSYFGDSTQFEENNCQFFPDEMALLQSFISLVREWDPEIIVGYEVERASLGYIMERSKRLGINMPKELSRLLPIILPFQNQKNQTSGEAANQIESWNGNINGRIVLNLWNILRKEITVCSYTFESAAYHILHQRYPHFDHTVLASFYLDQCHRHKVLSYFKSRVYGTIEMMEKLDIINRTSELARLFGIQFFEVFSRGSQYRVESMMLRLAKPANLIPFSPTPQQRSIQKAPEFLPLILEPESKYYTDPVAVLDFQSLYPSMIIAYNYCYSTVLGRTDNFAKDEPIMLGCGIHENGNEEISNLDPESVHISPAGVVFVKSRIKSGIMPQMLEQILETRLMVKKSMKQWSGPEYKTLQKILDSRQLGLKLISNVTYGYTSAHFSGRMPCVEIADSILSKGRETLQRAINLVQENQEKWGGRVVYGDTDSLFVLFAGKSREYAWKMAQDIADEVTKENPKPVKLKLEKIYQPCILQTKKRYVGYSYETPDQKEPKYDAKGIETVRRDGCPAVKKILEVGIRTLFETNNPKELKKYIDFQFRKLFLGRVSLSDYTFARQYRGRAGYKPTASVPSLEIAKKMTLKDPMAEPLTKERVPYVVVYGDPKLPLIQLVRRPIEVIENKNLRLNAHYYIEKAIIPALNRCFQLAKIDIQQWYKELPRKYMRAYQGNLDGVAKKKATISDYFISEKCIRCDERTFVGHYFCPKCTDNGQISAIDLICRLKRIEARYHTAKKICLMCSKDDNKCLNFDCDIFHKLQRFQEDFNNSDKLVKILYLSDW